MTAIRAAVAAATLALAGLASGQAQAWTLLNWTGSPNAQIWGAPWGTSNNTIATSPLRWDTTDVGVWFRIYFEGRTEDYMNGTQDLPGLAGSVLVQLNNVDTLAKQWTFSYEVANASNNLAGNYTLSSKITIFGFDVHPDETTISTTGFFSKYKQDGKTVGFSGVGKQDFCLKNNNDNNCTGGDGNSGEAVDAGEMVTGTFTLGYTQSQTELVFTDPYIRFQAISFQVPGQNVRGDASGIGSAMAWVPEPATWALMILGFGGAGVALRRRRALAA